MIDIKYYENGTLKTKSVQEDDSSFRYRAIMGDDSITLKFMLAEAIEFPVGTFVEFQGSTYTLTSPENWSRYGNQNIEYTMLLNGVSATLGKYKLRNLQDNRLKFSMCTTPSEFLDLIVGNLNQSGRSSGWIAQCNIDVSEQKTIEFNHTYLIDALKSIADTFKTEYEITSSKVIKLGKVEYNKNNPLPLAYGRGNGFKAGTGRTNSNESKPVEILYVQGGERNIDRSKYGSAELHLPKGQKLEYEGRTYISDEDGLSIRRYGVEPKYGNEDSFDGSEIYPKRIGTVSAVTVVDADAHFYDFSDSGIPNNLDYNDVLIDGETMTVIFQTGMLAGREFEISKYTHNGRIFEIVPQEIDGIQMPDNTWKPEVGDKYIIYGCTLPDTYIADDDTKTGAEWDLFREAARNMYENEDFKFTFSGELQGKWAKEHWVNVGGKLIIGGYVRFLDTHFASQGVDIRITGIKEFLGDPYSPIIEISNSIVSAGAFESALRESSNQDVKIGEVLSNALSFTKRRFRDTQETISMLEAAFDDKFSKGINPVSIQTMAMLVGDERLQFKVYNTSFTSIIPFPATFSNGVLSIEACGIRHFSLGITDAAITTSRSEDSYKKWDLSAQRLTPSDAASAYYLYAKVSRTSSSSASFELSTEVKTIDDTSGYYYLLVGVLSSMSDDGKRSLAPLFGYTEILPNQILTSSIRSANGDTIFDLETGILSLNSNSSDSGQGAGINGRLTLSQIAAWFGGPMIDHELNPDATEFAKSLFRFNGTGYLASGNITWDEKGYGQVGGEGDNYALKWNDKEVRIGPNIKLGAGDETIAMLANLLNMFELDTTSVAGKTLIHAKYDGLYSDGDIAAGGAFAGTPSGGGETYLNELLDVQLATSSLNVGDMLMWNGVKYVNIPQSSITPDLSAYATQQWVLDKKYLTSVPVTSVVGQTGNITAAQVATALTNAGYKLTDTTYKLATTTSNGLMSATDKTKLDGIDANANNYTLPTASSSTKGGIKVGTTLSISGEVIDLKSGFPKGTYTKVQIDDYGRVSSGSTLSAPDIPSLPWSKITTGKPTTISGYGITDAYTKTETDNKVEALQRLLDSMFVRVYDSNNKLTRIHSNVTISSSGDLVAGGNSEGGTPSGGAFTQLEWNAIKALTQSESGLLASAYAVKEAYNELNTAIETLAGKATNVTFTQTIKSGKQIGSISIDGKSTSLYAPASYAWSEITGKPSFAAVATSGSYTDLANKPTIASLMGSTAIGGTSSYIYWNGSAWATKALGSNAFTSISKVSQLTNDSGYITGITKAMVETVLTGNITSHTHSYLPLSGGTMANTNKVTNLNADLLDGYHKDDILRRSVNPASVISLNDVIAYGIDFTSWSYAYSENINNQPGGDGVSSAAGVVSFGVDYPFQIYSDYNNTDKLFYRSFYINTGWKAWRQFAFLDSNVASASKWENARTITLTGSVTGSVSLDGSGNVSLDTTTNHTHTFASLASKPTTLSGYGITDASRIFRYTIPASGNKGVRITFTSGEPVKITVSGANQGAQLVLIGTGYGEGGFVRNNFTEVVPSTNALYTWCVSEKDARSVEIFSARATPDVVTVESPSPVTFTAISALSTDAAYRHLLTSANYSSYALPLTGGTIIGSIRMDGDTIRPLLIRNYSSLYNGGWARSVLECRVDDKKAFAIMPFGNYTSGATDNKIQYVSLGFAGYDGLNLRISDTSLTWGNNAIYHAGNFIDGVNYISPKTTLKGYGIEDWVLEHTANSPDTFQTAGVYRVSDVGTTGDGYDFRYGQVLVLRGGTSSDTIAQIAAPYFGSDLYFRSGTISNFTDAAHPWWTIYTSGNCNLPTIPWKCSSLTANGSVEAKANLYGQSLEFSNIGSSAGNGGYIDFHYNGNTADYTSRIIEDAAGQLTLSAGIVNIGTAAKGFLYLQRPSSNYIWANKAGGEICIGTADGGETSALNSGITIIGKRVYIGGTNSGSDALNVAGDVKASGWCKATNGLLIEESGVYYTHHSQFGEIDMANGNEFIWGSKTDTLYFNYRPSANKTTTVAHYIWNAGSPTTYATHTMGTLTVLGAITATTTIHATTGIYTDGYISAKQASASSDRRLKKDFCKIDNALKYVLKTHYTRFRWKDDDKESIGIIAQEEQNREYGFLVQNRKEIGHLTYDYAASTALLGAAIQEEDSKVEKLRKRIIKLENELSNLKKKWQH